MISSYFIPFMGYFGTSGGAPKGARITSSTGRWDRKAEEFAATDLAWGHGSSWVRGKV